MSVSQSNTSEALRQAVEQVRNISAGFRQKTETSKMNWSDRRQNEFFRKYVQTYLTQLDKAVNELNGIQAEIARMESSLNRYRNNG